MINRKKCFITWHYQARSRNLAKVLNIDIFEREIIGSMFWRHSVSSIWTIIILFIQRPRVIYIQYSFLLLIIVAIYKIIRFCKVVVICDSHTKALRRMANGFFNHIFRPIKKWSFKYADLMIISNENNIKEAKIFHSQIFVLPDPIPNIRIESIHSGDYKYCVFISSFAADEPIEQVIEAVQFLKSDIKLFWTGRIPKNMRNFDQRIKNIVFTSYLNNDAYHNLIGNADCLLVLTNEEGCLMSGANEGLAVGVPMVLSDTKTLRAFFSDAAVYCNHHPEDISKAIHYAIKNKDSIKRKIYKIRKIKRSKFSQSLNRLSIIVENLVVNLYDQRQL